jgi:hypothetical protein
VKAFIAGELEGVLQERSLAGWTERDVRLFCWRLTAFGRGPATSAAARLHEQGWQEVSVWDDHPPSGAPGYCSTCCPLFS